MSARGPGIEAGTAGTPSADSGRVAVVADSHLGGPGGDAAALIRQLRSLTDLGCRRLILLGDIFHVWVAHRSFETPEIRQVVAELRRLRAEGIRVDYIEGNRDFFLAGSPYADAFDFVGAEIAFEAAGRRVLAVHGDGLNDADRQYLFWRWLSKSRPSRLFFRLLPKRLAQRIVKGTEARLARTNFKHKMRIPEEVIRAYARRRLAEGHDLLILGHFHEARTWEVGDGEVRLLEAWFSSRKVEWIP